MMDKQLLIEQVAEKIHDGMTLMIGGFLGVGTPLGIIDSLVEKGVRNLTVIANDTAFPDKGIGKLIVNKQVKKCIVSHRHQPRDRPPDDPGTWSRPRKVLGGKSVPAARHRRILTPQASAP
jgi:acyl CoA:acetate/3-ketoacid CoA transferase alpha subunit